MPRSSSSESACSSGSSVAMYSACCASRFSRRPSPTRRTFSSLPRPAVAIAEQGSRSAISSPGLHGGLTARALASESMLRVLGFVSRPRARVRRRSSDRARTAGRRPDLQRRRRRHRRGVCRRVPARLPRGAALERRHARRPAARESLLRQREHRQRRRRRDRDAGQGAVADLHRREHPRVVALDERQADEGETDRVPGRRRRRAAAGDPRQRLGGLAPVCDRADDHRARPERVTPLLADSGRSCRLLERPLPRVRRGARERTRVVDLSCRKADPGAHVRTRRRPDRAARRARADRRDAGGAADPWSHLRALGRAAARCTVARLLRGDRRIRDRAANCGCVGSPTGATASSGSSSHGSTRSSDGAASPTRPDASSASTSGRSSAAPSRPERPEPRTGRRRGADRRRTGRPRRVRARPPRGPGTSAPGSASHPRPRRRRPGGLPRRSTAG